MGSYILFSAITALLFAFCCAVRSDHVRWKFFGLLALGMFIITGAMCWASLPSLSFSAYFMPTYWLVFGIIAVAVNIMTDEDTHITMCIQGGVALLFFVYAFFSTCTMFNAGRYHRILQVEVAQDSILEKEITPISIDDMISVDAALAKKIAESKIEQMPSLGSVAHVGKMSIQNLTGEFTIKDGDGKTHDLKFNNEQIWVAPLEHNDWKKWWSSGTTPGYMIVSAINRERAYFVTEVNGKKLSSNI